MLFSDVDRVDIFCCLAHPRMESNRIRLDRCSAGICSGTPVDCGVDLEDYAALADCMAGPNATPNPPLAGVTFQDCLDAFDFDEDSDVDMRDFTVFLIAHNPGD